MLRLAFIISLIVLGIGWPIRADEPLLPELEPEPALPTLPDFLFPEDSPPTSDAQTPVANRGKPPLLSSVWKPPAPSAEKLAAEDLIWKKIQDRAAAEARRRQARLHGRTLPTSTHRAYVGPALLKKPELYQIRSGIDLRAAAIPFGMR